MGWWSVTEERVEGVPILALRGGPIGRFCARSEDFVAKEATEIGPVLGANLLVYGLTAVPVRPPAEELAVQTAAQIGIARRAGRASVDLHGVIQFMTAPETSSHCLIIPEPVDRPPVVRPVLSVLAFRGSGQIQGQPDRGEIPSSAAFPTR